ncbi:CheR family methyltransferase [Methylocaldum sp.]|uniref:CheR family methyltransferase n=1 Tax=Methylocaldum sp. TaxID=1969727 RepID=UPI002D33D0B7|nr:CheR family methyltransferase [Methylocaldum sp.]HYE36755.1 CheR family methyltransferase [Methylocaldum sp.]
MDSLTISDHEFRQFQKLLYDISGIHLSPAKKPLVCGRLARRLGQHGLNSYGDYFRLLTNGGETEELQHALDLLTTNETYFFREPKHFDFLKQNILSARHPARTFRIWSAACSSGEEPYSIAMVLAERLGSAPWEVLGSDISRRVLEKARLGHYPMERAKNIPRDHLTRYCLKGVGSQEGTFLIDKTLKNRMRFMHINLNGPLPKIGEFDAIFLRNVMIYFDQAVKRQVVARLSRTLKSGGYFIVGHAETLNGVDETLEPVAPTVYRKR